MSNKTIEEEIKEKATGAVIDVWVDGKIWKEDYELVDGSTELSDLHKQGKSVQVNLGNGRVVVR